MAAEDQKVCTLAEAMAEEGLVSLSRATELIEQIVAALQAAQIRGRTLFHLEPRTILVTESTHENPDGGRRPRVIGLAPRKDPLVSRSDGPDAAAGDSTSLPLPLSHETPVLAIDDPAQQVALAAIAYEMLAGCSPFAEDAGAAVDQATRPAPPPLSELVVGVPTALDEVFRRALSPVPEQRFPSLDDLVRALRGIANGRPRADAGAEVAPLSDKGTVADELVPLRLLPPTGDAVAWVTSADEPTGHTPIPGNTPVPGDTPVPSGRTTGETATLAASRSAAALAAAGARTPEPGAPIVLASLTAAARPSRRTQVSFLAAAFFILIAAVGVMSGSRKKVGAEEPPAESAAAPTRPVIIPSSPRPIPVAPVRPAAPAPPVAEPAASIETPRTTHRRSRRHALHRPRAARR